MDTLNYSEFNDICRICLTKCITKCIGDASVSNIFHKITELDFRTDNLPQHVCLKCFEKINQIYAFSFQCKQSHYALLECYNKQLKPEPEPQKEQIVEVAFVDIPNEYGNDIEEEEETTTSSDGMKTEKTEDLKEEILDLEPDLISDETEEHISEGEGEDEDVAKAQNTSDNLIPPGSAERYNMQYNAFNLWKRMNHISSTSETVLLDYFKHRSEKFAPSTLWSNYSMLRAKLLQTEDVDISKYTSLKSFLKKQSVNYEPRKSRILTAEQAQQFFNTAPDFLFLDVKVILTCGILGGCTGKELKNLKTTDLEHHGELILVKIRKEVAKNRQPRSFVIEGEYRQCMLKYLSLRPDGLPDNRLFVKYLKGHDKCARQFIGEHKFDEAPKTIAAFLQLPNPKEYTGHSFRRILSLKPARNTERPYKFFKLS